jgi:hypothetical protein
MASWFKDIWRRFSPAALWRRHKAAAARRRHYRAGYVKVMFDLTGGARSIPEALATPPQDLCEWMWAEPAGPGLFRLSNSPFYAYGVSLGDVVSVAMREGLPVVTGIAERGGRTTYRVLRAEALADEVWDEEWAQLNTLGCVCESDGDRLVAIDVPAETDVAAVFRLLEEGENLGFWAFEEVWFGHPSVPASVGARHGHHHR